MQFIEFLFYRHWFKGRAYFALCQILLIKTTRCEEYGRRFSYQHMLHILMALTDNQGKKKRYGYIYIILSFFRYYKK